MKTITLDYDLYQAELEQAREDGKVYGFSLASEYIKDKDDYRVEDGKYKYHKKAIDKAILEQHDPVVVLNRLLDKEDIMVFDTLAGKDHPCMGFNWNGPSVQINIEVINDDVKDRIA